jgi:hypothetical protein
MSDLKQYKKMFELKQDDWFEACKEIDKLESQVAQARARIEKLSLVADAAVQLYNALAAQSGAHFEHMKAEWPELRHLKASFDNLKKET